MHFTDDPASTPGQADRRWLLLTALSAAVAGCATRPPAPAPAPAPARPPAPVPTPPAAPPPAAAPAPAQASPAPSAGAAGLPAPAASRNWDEFRRNAGRRLVAAHPGSTYMGRPPDILFGIPVIETELYVDGTIKAIRVLREPSDARARDTVQLAMAAIRRAAPYGDVSRLPQPWKWVETFLFDDQRRFKPRSLD